MNNESTLEDVLRTATRAYLHRMLLATAGNVSAMAKIAGRNRSELYRLLDRHGIVPALYRGIE